MSVILILLVFLQSDVKTIRSELYCNLFGYKTSINYVYRESSVVLSGDIIRNTPNSLVLRHIVFHKGNLNISDSLCVSWPDWLRTDLQIGDRAFLFADSGGVILSNYGFGLHHPGCIEMRAFEINSDMYHLHELIAPEPTILTRDMLDLITRGKCLNPEFVPVSARIYFPSIDEIIEFSVIENCDTMMTASSISLMDSNPVDMCLTRYGLGITLGTRVKKNRNYSYVWFTLTNGRNLFYKNGNLFIDYFARSWRSLEEFLDFAATGHKQIYEIEITPGESLIEFGLAGRMYFTMNHRICPGLVIADSIPLRYNQSISLDGFDRSNGYLVFSLEDVSDDATTILLHFADPALVGPIEDWTFLEQVSRESFVGEILILLPCDSTPRFHSRFTCEVDDYDDLLSNKESYPLYQDSACREMYGGNKPVYFLTEATEPVILTVDYSETMRTDSVSTFAWLVSTEGEEIFPSEISIGVAEVIPNANSQFTYRFEFPDSITGRYFVHLRATDMSGEPLTWPYGRPFYGIVDVVDNGSLTEKEGISRETVAQPTHEPDACKGTG